MGLFCRGGGRLGHVAKRLLLPLNQRHNRVHTASAFLWLVDSKGKKKPAALFLNAKIMFMFVSTKGLMSKASLECLMYWDMHVTRLPPGVPDERRLSVGLHNLLFH